MTEAIFVEAPARLHFGVLDLRGSLGRWFGGIGAGRAGADAAGLSLGGGCPGSPGRGCRARGGLRPAVSGASPSDGGARVSVHRALPAHAGLGSGTQLALAVARALAEHPRRRHQRGRARRGGWPCAALRDRHVDVRRQADSCSREAAGVKAKGSRPFWLACPFLRPGAASSRCRTRRRDERRSRSRGLCEAPAAAGARSGARGASCVDGAAARACRMPILNDSGRH